MNITEAWAKLTRETGLSKQDWLDLLALPQPALEQALKTYSHLDWTKPGTPAWAIVLQCLPVIAQIASIASGANATKQILDIK